MAQDPCMTMDIFVAQNLYMQLMEGIPRHFMLRDGGT